MVNGNKGCLVREQGKSSVCFWETHRCVKHRKIGKRRIKSWLLLLATMIFFLYIWSALAERKARVIPDYPKVSIEALLYKEQLTTEEYELLLLQTGLSRGVIDHLLQNGSQQEILMVQENFFREIDIVCEANTIISREERCGGEQQGDESHKEVYEGKEQKREFAGEAYIPYVETGDILISFNSHVFGWRNGHAAIVVDGEQRQTLEARVLGMDSKVMSMEHWEKYPSFVVLRLKGATVEERKAIAEYAEENLVGIPYHLTAGLERLVKVPEGFEKGEDAFADEVTETGSVSEVVESGVQDVKTVVSGTHCSHLVWYAYQQFVYNLDSDGGGIVTPR